ncbi:MAG TPA: hypothetical protein VNZ49_08545 [Bacteroidia bacterium]|jgi:hypothetical protein|nr:hypothetical protein [Bacteroidia bacterium]
MFNSIVLDVVTGLIFVYLLYSLLVTIVAELIATLFAFRAKFLKVSITRMLTDKKNKKSRTDSLVKTFYNHPNIKYLAKNNLFKLPSEITSDRFSTTLINILRKKKAAPTVMEEIKVGMAYFDLTEHSETKKTLTDLIEDANGDLATFKDSLENWYNEMIDRVIGWYKRRMKFVLFIIGLIISVSFNVDSIRIAKTLTNNNDARYKVLKMATDPAVKQKLGDIIKYSQKADSTKNDSIIRSQYDTLRTYSDKMSDIVGGSFCTTWDKNDCSGRFLMIFGCLLTSLALSLGAPFWFDLLSKLVALRGGGKSTEPPAKDENVHISNLQTNDNGHHLSEHTTDDVVLLAVAKYKSALFSIPGVIAVNKGFTYSGDQKTPCVEITVTKQCNQKLIPVLTIIQNEIATTVTSKISLGNIAKSHSLLIQNEYYSGKEEGKGTLTCVINDGKKTALLSCYHVMQGNNVYPALNGNLSLITPDAKSKVGNIYYLYQSEAMDVGLAESTSQISNPAYIKGIRPVSENDSNQETPVTIYGAFSPDPIKAVVYQDTVDYPFIYNGQEVMMRNLIKLTKYNGTNHEMPSIGGDSGAIVCDDKGMAIGMIIGGIDGYSYALKITEVFNSLKINLKK